MALIAKTFKADLGNENLKGNILPQDLSAIIDFLNSEEAGILNIPEKDCSQFGNINITGEKALVTFHAGYIIIRGRLVYIEEGTEVAFNLPSSGSVNGILGIKIDLSESGANEVTWFQKTGGAVTDDLVKKETNGVYEFVLYNYTATNSAFTLGAKTSRLINKTPKLLEILENQVFKTQPLHDYSNNPASTKFVKESIKFVSGDDLVFRVTSITAWFTNEKKGQHSSRENQFNLKASGVIYTTKDDKKYFYGNLDGQIPQIGEREFSGNLYSFAFSIGNPTDYGALKKVVNGGMLHRTHFGSDNMNDLGTFGVGYTSDQIMGSSKSAEDNRLVYISPQPVAWKRYSFTTTIRIIGAILELK